MAERRTGSERKRMKRELKMRLATAHSVVYRSYNRSKLNKEQDENIAESKARVGSLVHAKFLKVCRSGRVEDAHKLLELHPQLDLDAVGNDHKTPLYHAIVSHSLPLVQMLIARGADVSRRSFVFFRVDCSAVNFESCDEPPIVTAARTGTIEILLTLLEAGADPSDQSEIPHSHGPASAVTVPASRGRGGSALHFACEKADVEVVRVLVEAGADVDTVDSKCERPLHIAARCKPSVCAAQRDIVELLTDAGADTEAVNRKDCVPLFLSALYGCTAKVEALIRHGSSVNGSSSTERDSGYGSALHVAAYKDRLELSALLICAGAKLDRRNGAGYTPLALNITAQAKSEIASLLVYHGARTDTWVDPKREGMTLMATCIGGMRLDCESLAVLMVQAGYNLNQDLWLVPEHFREDFAESSEETVATPTVPIAAGRVRRLCDWLWKVQSNPRSLAELCRKSIRIHLNECTGGTSIVASVGALPLPGVLKNFILLKDPTGSTMESTIMDYLVSVKER